MTSSPASSAVRSHHRALGIFAALLMATPAVVFYRILFATAINIPCLDDYNSHLGFANALRAAPSFPARAACFLTTQQNEYKLFFEKAVICLQLVLCGHLDFRSLSLIGDSFVLLLAVVLWMMFLPRQRNTALRLALFVPVPWLLFQLQYWETLNWANSSLQNVPVLPFSLMCIYLLTRPAARAFALALVFFALGVGASGNGLLLIPLGLLMLALDRHWRRVGIWLLVSAVCVTAYAYRYQLMPPHGVTPGHASLLSEALLRPLYVVAFLGGAASYPFHLGAILLGAALLLYFGWLTRQGYRQHNPGVFFSVLFIVLTACGVSGIRSDLGLAQSFSSRYLMYSALMVIFAWFAIAETLVKDQRLTARGRAILVAATTIAILFCLTMDRRGAPFLYQRNQILIQGMAAYQHPGSQPYPGPITPFLAPTPGAEEVYAQAHRALREASARGIYQPAPY